MSILLMTRKKIILHLIYRYVSIGYIIICRGTTVGTIEVSDDCISIKTEAVQPQWVLKTPTSLIGLTIMLFVIFDIFYPRQAAIGGGYVF